MMPEPERELEHESADLEKQPRKVDPAEVIFGEDEPVHYILETGGGDFEEDEEDEDRILLDLSQEDEEDEEDERLAKAERDLVKLKGGRVARLIRWTYKMDARSVDSAFAAIVAALFTGVVGTTLVLMLAAFGAYGIGTVRAVCNLTVVFAVVSLTLVYSFFVILRAIHTVLVQILDRLPREPAGSAPVPIATGGSPAAPASDKIVFYCPNGHHVSATAKWAGKKMMCPKCHEIFVVPSVSEPKRPSGNARSL